MISSNVVMPRGLVAFDFIAFATPLSFCDFCLITSRVRSFAVLPCSSLSLFFGALCSTGCAYAFRVSRYFSMLRGMRLISSRPISSRPDTSPALCGGSFESCLSPCTTTSVSGGSGVSPVDSQTNSRSRGSLSPAVERSEMN